MGQRLACGSRTTGARRRRTPIRLTRSSSPYVGDRPSSSTSRHKIRAGASVPMRTTTSVPSISVGAPHFAQIKLGMPWRSRDVCCRTSGQTSMCAFCARLGTRAPQRASHSTGSNGHPSSRWARNDARLPTKVHPPASPEPPECGQEILTPSAATSRHASSTSCRRQTRSCSAKRARGVSIRQRVHRMRVAAHSTMVCRSMRHLGW
eukprot:scaffold185184_cov29-Tisochrysis_lutea.AAC.7